MRVEVALAPALVPVPLPADYAVVVIDTLRATSTIAAALAAGCLGVRPVADLEQARQRAAADGALLAGERGGLPPEGFDLGNSPDEFTPERCAGRQIVLSTTNGTAAMARCAQASSLFAASLLNAEATCRALAERGAGQVLLVCAGSRGRVAADDVVAAGCLVGSLALLAAATPGDGARVAAALFDAWRADLPGLLRRSGSGARLLRLGLGRDLVRCAAVDSVPLVAERDADGVFRRR